MRGQQVRQPVSAIPGSHGWLDRGTAALVGGAVVATSMSEPTLPVLLYLGASAALAWRRSRPSRSAVAVAALVLSAWVASTLGVSGSDRWLIETGGGLLALAVYSAVAYGRRRLAWAALPFAVAAAVLAGLGLSGLAVTEAMVAAVAVALLAWTLGQWRYSQRAYVASLLERTERAEADREIAAQLALERDRARLAHELHDVVAHSLAVMTAQADGAFYVLETSPAAAGEALRTVADTGRAAMQDMRDVLDVLAAEPDPRAATSRQPQPGLRDLPALIDAVRSSGLPTSLHVVGDEHELPPGAQLAVYRLVQESLTNVLKHAGRTARAEVAMTWFAHKVTVTVTDDGAGSTATAAGGGRGLTGMRERLAQLGGTVNAGPCRTAGFAVTASIPLPPRPPLPPQPLNSASRTS